MNSTRFICKTTNCTRIAEQIESFCKEHAVVISSEDANPYWKYDDCVESVVTFDNQTDKALLERLLPKFSVQSTTRMKTRHSTTHIITQTAATTSPLRSCISTSENPPTDCLP